MKIQILGSGAGEGIPALFCDCPLCENARKVKGKEIRFRSSALINDNVFIDFSPDINEMCIRNDIRAYQAKAVFFTHSHIDHLASYELCMRDSGYCYLPADQPLNVYCNEKCENEIRRAALFDSFEECNYIRFHRLSYFQPVQVDNLTITPLPAKHAEEEEAMLFLIEDGKDRIFYGTDSGIIPEPTEKFMKGKILSAAFLDCTYGCERYTAGSHMGVGANRDFRARMTAQGSSDEHTRWFMTHISHHTEMNHAELVEAVKPFDLHVAYDGMIYDTENDPF